jgi:uncharacterized protein (TIGR02217 family)
MGFHNVRFPTNVDYGASGGSGMNTSVVQTGSGAIQTIQRWSGAGLHSFDAAYNVKTLDDLYLVKEFYIARGGPANSFRYKDWLDYTTGAGGTGAVTDTDFEIAAGDATETAFQLIKKYTSGGVVVSRNIRLPVSGTVVIAVATVSQTEGVDFTVNTTTGIVTFASAPSNLASITAGFQFDVPVFFGKEVDFNFSASIDSFDSGGIPSIPLIEDLNEIADPEIKFNGGSKDFGTTTTVQTITIADGSALRFTCNTDHNLIFPLVTSIEPGGPIFLIVNDGSATLSLKYSDGTSSIGSMLTGTVAELWLVENGTSGLKEWQMK